MIEIAKKFELQLAYRQSKLRKTKMSSQLFMSLELLFRGTFLGRTFPLTLLATGRLNKIIVEVGLAKIVGQLITQSSQSHTKLPGSTLFLVSLCFRQPHEVFLLKPEINSAA